MSERPTVFIGSSAEGLEIARFLHAHLDHDFRPRIWEHGLFQPGNYALEDLEEAARSHHFAILCATPDDVLIKRGKKSVAMRDNVLLELGLFMGACGRRHAFLLVPKGKRKVALPTDLFGITYVDYDAERFSSGDPSEQHAALASAALKLKAAMLKRWSARRAANGSSRSESLHAARKKSAQRIHAMIVDLRDLVLELPPQVIEAIPAPARFKEVKDSAARRVAKIAASFASDAETVGVVTEFNGLVAATKNALLNIPHPVDMIPSEEELMRVGIQHVADAVHEQFTRGNGFKAFAGSIEEELIQRLQAFAEKYRDWWNQSERQLQRATIDLQAALMHATLDGGPQTAPGL